MSAATPTKSARQRFHDFCADRTRAQKGDLDAAERYEGLAKQAEADAIAQAAFYADHGVSYEPDAPGDYGTPEYYRAQAVACRDSAAAHMQAISDRLAGKRRKS